MLRAMNSKARNKTGKGYFTVEGNEPLAKRPIAVRLPESLDIELREIAGDDLSNWIRKAVLERLKKDKQSLSDKTA